MFKGSEPLDVGIGSTMFRKDSCWTNERNPSVTSRGTHTGASLFTGAPKHVVCLLASLSKPLNKKWGTLKTHHSQSRPDVARPADFGTKAHEFQSTLGNHGKAGRLLVFAGESNHSRGSDSGAKWTSFVHPQYW